MKTFKRYVPLFVLLGVAFLAASALSYANFSLWPHFFMGFFLCQFAMLKLFDLSGFVQGFQMYDIAAKKMSGYAYFYPFIELFLGLSYLSFIFPKVTYILTIVIMSFGVIGVIKALIQKLDVRCACMGTTLNVPLSTVTLFEDIAMGGMALWMLIS